MGAARSKQDWHPEDVKAAIRKTGISLSALAAHNGYAISAVKMTLRRRSAPVQAIIAAQLNLRPQDIWPSRYDELGQPIDNRGHRKSAGRRNISRGSAAAQRQNNGVA